MTEKYGDKEIKLLIKKNWQTIKEHDNYNYENKEKIIFLRGRMQIAEVIINKLTILSYYAEPKKFTR